MFHPVHNTERIGHFLPRPLSENFRVSIKIVPRGSHATKADGIY
jgi:hypothetical protein